MLVDPELASLIEPPAARYVEKFSQPQTVDELQLLFLACWELGQETNQSLADVWDRALPGELQAPFGDWARNSPAERLRRIGASITGPRWAMAQTDGVEIIALLANGDLSFAQST